MIKRNNSGREISKTLQSTVIIHMKIVSSVIPTPYGIITMARKPNKSQSQRPKDSEPCPPRITSNVKQNLEFLKLWKELQKRKSSLPKPATSYRRKKVEKECLPQDTKVYQDPTLTLYYTNQELDTAVPVLLVDGYNMCGYWMKLKKHFAAGRLDAARQKLVDELVQFSLAREVKVVVVFDAMMSGLPTHKENFAGVDVIYSGESCADAWIEKEVAALREDGCPKVWVATSDQGQQHAAHGAGAFVWSCKALLSEARLDIGNTWTIRGKNRICCKSVDDIVALKLPLTGALLFFAKPANTMQCAI
ncbi:hypothetical protein Nepgr_008759 [Nepenthes gracilis]|uniref:YacP-like NYN domain protein n=1 Tax=Nepenthes gracilis TaxID=150966 RepID=A0AAD3S9P2_NEPGR|nr:hypothetical protein Nepgr_008759 [Nepenthes gracilis]